MKGGRALWGPETWQTWEGLRWGGDAGHQEATSVLLQVSHITFGNVIRCGGRVLCVKQDFWEESSSLPHTQHHDTLRAGGSLTPGGQKGWQERLEAGEREVEGHGKGDPEGSGEGDRGDRWEEV